MPDCPSIDPLVTRFVDGDLPSSERQLVADHIRACAPCRSRIAAEQAARGVVRSGKRFLEQDRASDALRARCAALMAAEADRIPPAAASPAGALPYAAARKPGWTRRVTPLALAATLVLVVAGAFLYRFTETSPQLMAAELTADHVKC